MALWVCGPECGSSPKQAKQADMLYARLHTGFLSKACWHYILGFVLALLTNQQSKLTCYILNFTLAFFLRKTAKLADMLHTRLWTGFVSKLTKQADILYARLCTSFVSKLAKQVDVLQYMLGFELVLSAN